MKGYLSSLLLGCFVLLESYQIFGQGTVVNLNEKIPIDQNLRYGELENGFKYYLRKCKKDKGKVQVYFLVKVGEENEQKNQYEFSHLLEHIALNGTKDFPDVRFFLQQRGVLWGSNFNGRTSAKNTVYNFFIPEGNRELLTNCLAIIKNWANEEISFDSAIVNAEKGAVLQELAGNVGEFSRLRKDFLAAVVGQGNHNGRVQVDTRSTVAGAASLQLTRFYYDWYIPGREGLVILGDFDVDSLERQVRNEFGNLKVTPGKGKLREVYFSPAKLHGRNGVYIMKKGEEQFIEGKIVLKSAYRPIINYADLKDDLIRTLLSSLMDFRFKNANRIEREQGYSVRYNHEFSAYGKPFSSFDIEFQCDSAHLKSTYIGLLEELFRIGELGFSVEEFRLVKDRLKKAFDRSYSEECDLELKDYMANFMRGDAIPAPESRNRFVLDILDGLVPEDVSRFLEKYPFTRNRDVVFFVPRSYKNGLVSVSKIEKWNEEAEKNPLKMFQYINQGPGQVVKKSFSPLMTEEEIRLLGNRISSKAGKKVAAADVVTVRLDNGIQVVLKSLTSDDDSVVYIQGLKRLGPFVKDRQDSLLEVCSPDLVSSSGPRGYSAGEWREYKVQKKIVISHNIKVGGVSILGSGRPDAVEGILQAMRLSIVSPKIDSVFFEKWRHRQVGQIQIYKDGLSGQSAKYLSTLNGKFSPLAAFKKESEVLQINPNDVLKKYKGMYACNDEYTFFVCGNFDLDSMSLLLNKYIGTIPIVERKRGTMSPSIHIGNSFSQTRVFYDSNLVTSRIDILFPVTMPKEVCAKVPAQIVADELRRLVLNRLRTREGVSYGPTVNLSAVGGRNYVVSVYFDCANDRIEDGVRFVKEEFARLRESSTQELFFEASKTLVKSQIRDESRKPSFWLQYFDETFFGGWDIDRLMDCNNVIDDISLHSILDIIRLFSADEAMVFVLRPPGSSAN